MHLIITERGSEPFLRQELRRGFPGAAHRVSQPGLVVSDFVFQPELPPLLVFARQFLPDAIAVQANSISEWAKLVAAAIGTRLDPEQPWLLHIEPNYSSRTGGENRCKLIREGVQEQLRRTHRQLLKQLQAEPRPFTAAHSVVQLLLGTPEQGYLSIADAPSAYALRQVLSPFPKGEIPPAHDKQAPSRAFAKLVEAELRLGRPIASGETCVDLGASPGSWTYVTLQRGARVTAVDRAPLRADVMEHPGLVFKAGDGFAYTPQGSVDWLLCDIIAAPERSIGLLLDWLRHGWMRRFVVTIKFKGIEEYEQLERLKHAQRGLCREFYLTRLCANKNEVCAFGVAARG